MECLFCKIIKSEIPSFKIYEDEKTFVFMDIDPKANGHLLVIPKTHYKDIYEVPDEELLHINDITKNMHKLIMKKLGSNGITTVYNVGDELEVDHFHVHIIPDISKNNEIQNIQEIYEILK